MSEPSRFYIVQAQNQTQYLAAVQDSAVNGPTWTRDFSKALITQDGRQAVDMAVSVVLDSRQQVAVMLDGPIVGMVAHLVTGLCPAEPSDNRMRIGDARQQRADSPA